MPGVGDRQRREQSRPRRRRSGRRRGACRQGAGAEALPSARPWPHGQDFEAVLEPDHRRASGSRAKRLKETSHGSEGQSDRTAARHQPDLGFALVRRQERVRHAAARGHEDPQGAHDRAQAGGGVEDRDRAPAQEVPGDGPFGASGRGDRQEGRRHREAAQVGRQAHRQRRRHQHHRDQEARARRARWSRNRSPSSSSAAWRSAAP